MLHESGYTHFSEAKTLLGDGIVFEKQPPRFAMLLNPVGRIFATKTNIIFRDGNEITEDGGNYGENVEGTSERRIGVAVTAVTESELFPEAFIRPKSSAKPGTQVARLKGETESRPKGREILEGGPKGVRSDRKKTKKG